MKKVGTRATSPRRRSFSCCMGAKKCQRGTNKPTEAQAPFRLVSLDDAAAELRDEPRQPTMVYLEVASKVLRVFSKTQVDSQLATRLSSRG